MNIETVRYGLKLTAAAAIVSLVNLACVLGAPSSPAPLVAFLCLAFALLASMGGRSAVMVGLGVGALELALILPGEGFAVSQPDDALALIGTIAVGLSIGRYADRRERRERGLMERLEQAASEREGMSVFLGALSRRVANDLDMLKAVALSDMPARLDVLSRIYRRLRPVDAGDHIDARYFLASMCEDLQLLRPGLRRAQLSSDIGDIRLPLGPMIVIGLIANELLTNVGQHVFPKGRGCMARLSFRRHPFRPGILELAISDNGIAVGQAAGESQDLVLLVASLAAQLDGDVAFARIDDWTVASVQFPDPNLIPVADVIPIRSRMNQIAPAEDREDAAFAAL